MTGLDELAPHFRPAYNVPHLRRLLQNSPDHPIREKAYRLDYRSTFIPEYIAKARSHERLEMKL